MVWLDRGGALSFGAQSRKDLLSLRGYACYIDVSTFFFYKRQ